MPKNAMGAGAGLTTHLGYCLHLKHYRKAVALLKHISVDSTYASGRGSPISLSNPPPRGVVGRNSFVVYTGG